VSGTSKYAKKRDLHQRVKNNVGHVLTIIFLPNDKLNHKRSSSGVVGADEPLQWAKTKTIDCASTIFNNFGAQLQDQITVKNESLKNQAKSTSSTLRIRAIQ
jgi:hypothetical protein